MTGADRQHLKQLVDQRIRTLLADDTTPRCKGCHGELHHRTTGCRQCNDRHRRYQRRQTEPGYYERQREYDRQRRRRNPQNPQIPQTV